MRYILYLVLAPLMFLLLFTAMLFLALGASLYAIADELRRVKDEN